MKIFNVSIFGEDADWFCEQPKNVQKDWILSNTNQCDDTLIDELLSNINRGNDCDCGCAKCEKNGNISKNNVNEIAIVEPTEVGSDGKRGNRKRGNGTKNT
jgi:hypothetical protein